MYLVLSKYHQLDIIFVTLRSDIIWAFDLNTFLSKDI